MGVHIEELDAQIAPPAQEQRRERSQEPQLLDERKVLEALAYERWQQARLIAD